MQKPSNRKENWRQPVKFVRRLNEIEHLGWPHLQPLLDEEGALPESSEEIEHLYRQTLMMTRALLELKNDLIQARKIAEETEELDKNTRRELLLSYDSILRSIDVTFSRISRLRMRLELWMRKHA